MQIPKGWTDGIFDFRISNCDLRSLWWTKGKSQADARRRFSRCRDHAPVEPGRHGLSITQMITGMARHNPEGVDRIAAAEPQPLARPCDPSIYWLTRQR
jgi:hypothetical protein